MKTQCGLLHSTFWHLCLSSAHRRPDRLQPHARGVFWCPRRAGPGPAPSFLYASLAPPSSWRIWSSLARYWETERGSGRKENRSQYLIIEILPMIRQSPQQYGKKKVNKSVTGTRALCCVLKFNVWCQLISFQFAFCVACESKSYVFTTALPHSCDWLIRWGSGTARARAADSTCFPKKAGREVDSNIFEGRYSFLRRLQYIFISTYLFIYIFMYMYVCMCGGAGGGGHKLVIGQSKC